MGVVLTRAIGRVLSGFDIEITFAFRWQSLVLAFVLGMVTTFVVVLLAAGRTSALNIVRAVRDIPDPPGERPDFGGALREPYRRFFRGLGALARLRISGLRTATLGVAGAVYSAPSGYRSVPDGARWSSVSCSSSLAIAASSSAP